MDLKSAIVSPLVTKAAIVWNSKNYIGLTMPLEFTGISGLLLSLKQLSLLFNEMAF